MRTFSVLDGRFDRKNDNIATPKELYERFDAEFHFDHDPCPLNPEGCCGRQTVLETGVEATL